MEKSYALVEELMGRSRGHKSLHEFRDCFFRALSEGGMPEEEAAKWARTILLFFVQEFGGQQPYIPVSTSLVKVKECVECFDMWRKGAMRVEDIAKRLGVTRRTAYSILAEMRCEYRRTNK